MKLYHVVAIAKNRVIGKDNKLPWHFPEDLKFFKQLTTGNTVILGRKTFESIGKPLPNRTNFVLSRKIFVPDQLEKLFPSLKSDQVKSILLAKENKALDFFPSLEMALEQARTEKVFIIGGAELYKQTIDKVHGIYLTRIDREYDGDAFYPEIPDSFEEIEIEGLREADPKIETVYYEKISNAS